jgi:hypothetical protein
MFLLDYLFIKIKEFFCGKPEPVVPPAPEPEPVPEVPVKKAKAPAKKATTAKKTTKKG